MSIGIILPTLNEEEGIGKIIDEIETLNKKFNIYVVDGGSTDNTLKISKEKGATIIEVNKRGKGVAIKQAFEMIDDDLLVLMDSDMSYSAIDIPKVLEKLESFDVVIGSRFSGKIEEGAMKGINRIGNQALTTIGNILYGKKISDLCSGMWGFRKKAYKSMKINARHFDLEANLYTQSVKNKLKLCEIPIIYRRREGETKLTVIDGLKIGAYLAINRIR